ncbi:MAG: hypothetical protein ACOCX9_04310 [Spirochaetota bacterium]
MRTIKRTAVTILIFLACVAVLPLSHAQFLLDNGDGPVIQPKNEKKSKGLPSHVVRNIVASSVPDVEGAIKISWDIHPDSSNTFIVGRTAILPTTKEKALSATSIKVIPPGAEPVVIDSNLPPGQYYYVVLAREKIQSGDIELYPDVNYTGEPVVIASNYGEKQVQGYPEQVTLIHARLINKTQVLLTWKGLNRDNIKYNIYRDTKPLNTPQSIKNAKKIASIQGSRESYIDRDLEGTGNYYYAITTSDMTGNEDLQLIPDQSYLTTGVQVIVKSDVTVKNIESRMQDNGTVQVTWDRAGVNAQELLLYRYEEPIRNAERLALSDSLGTVDAKYNEYLDKNPPPGQHYYAVLTKLADGSIDTTLHSGQNYTTTPVKLGEPIEITRINASQEKNGVSITWRYRGSSRSKYYKLYRTNKIPSSPVEIKDTYLVDIVNVTEESYLDTGIRPGEYYYVIVPEDFESDPDLTLVKDVNITAKPVTIEKTVKKVEQKKKKKTREKVIPEEKEPERITPLPGKEFQAVTRDLDNIIHSTFDKGYYRTAIKSLQKVIDVSDNDYEAAKAKLFTGRSYIELKQYRKGIDYLMQKDVLKHFPEDALFWRDYAIQRVR